MYDSVLHRRRGMKIAGMRGLRFAVLAAGLCLALSWLPEDAYGPLSAATARTTAAVIGLWGLDARAAGTHIFLEGFAVRIIPECTAVFAAALFAAFVVSYPARMADRVSGLLLGIPVLLAANALRLAAVTAWGAWRPAHFPAAHAWFGQVFMALCVIAACRAWTGWAAGRPRGPAADRAAARFLAVLAVLFFVWAHASAGYVKALDGSLAVLFSLFDVRLAFDHRHAMYYETFNLVVCLALALSVPGAGVRRTWRALALWAAAAVACHAAGRICNVLFTAFHVWQAQPVSIAVNAVGQYAIPVGLWLGLRRRPAGISSEIHRPVIAV